jgi:zinc-binding alcohol dehydrogenase family protein
MIARQGERAMKAVGYQHSRPIEAEDSLLDLELEVPVPHGHDLLVEVRAVSVNPVDTKVRKRVDPVGETKVLGWDAAGVVRAVGEQVTLFRPGDAVFYAGAIDRPGTNAELHLVDERIVGPKPAKLGFAEAAALPLTAITAWEALFDRMRIVRSGGGGLLIVGGAGGVGSIAIQLARALTGMTVIATASRPETSRWVKELGAHHVADHAGDLEAEVKRLNVPVTHAFITTGTDQHFAAVAHLIAPQGHVCLIDDPAQPPDVRLLKQKSAALHWEFMFTRSLFRTPDMKAQHDLLTEVARLLDAGRVRTTLAQHMGRITAANLRAAHALIESGRARGKVVLEGF